MSLSVLESVLALTNSVPDLDLTVTASRNNLSVIGGERDRKNVTSVANETLESLARSKIPKTEGLIPRSRNGVGTVLGDGNILNNVRVTSKRSLGDTVGLLITGKVPDDQGLITGSRQKNIGVAARGSKGSDPAIVALKGSSENKNFVAHGIDRL